jgi:hypothetical protein
MDATDNILITMFMKLLVVHVMVPRVMCLLGQCEEEEGGVFVTNERINAVHTRSSVIN